MSVNSLPRACALPVLRVRSGRQPLVLPGFGLTRGIGLAWRTVIVAIPQAAIFLKSAAIAAGLAFIGLPFAMRWAGIGGPRSRGSPYRSGADRAARPYTLFNATGV